MTRSEWRLEKSEAVGRRGMVVADSPRAAEAGALMLEGGGNAVDAAVAAAFVMAVAEPWTSGVGGVAALLVHREGRTIVVDGSGVTPRAAHAGMFEILPSGSAGMYSWPATKDNAQHDGPLAVGVPGAVAALCHAHERYGRLGREEVLAPAIELAEQGFDVEWHVAAGLANYCERLWKNAEATRLFFRPSRAPFRSQLGLEPGDRLAQPELAATLRAIAADGDRAFYRGDIARAIVDEVRALGGILTSEDLADYRARELEPLTTTYRDVEVRTMPGASGGVTLVEALNILEGFHGLDRLDPDSVPVLHLIAEASRLAFHDRFAQVADGAEEAMARLASKDRAVELRGPAHAIEPGRAHPEAEPMLGDTAHTTQVTVVDADRTVISCTATLGQGFGSGVAPRGTGFVLTDVMTWFDPRPGHANSIAPGKRILWAIAPTIAFRGGRPWLAIGAPGGRRLITAVFQALVRAIEHGMAPQDAVNGIRVHCEGPLTLLDVRASPAIGEGLAALGHRIEFGEETPVSSMFGRANAIQIQEDGTLRAGVHRMKPTTAIGL